MAMVQREIALSEEAQRVVAQKMLARKTLKRKAPRKMVSLLPGNQVFLHLQYKRAAQHHVLFFYTQGSFCAS